MNHIFDTEDEEQSSTQLKFLKTLIDKLIKRLEEDSYKPRVQDALKAIQLQQKVAKTSEAEKFFWQEIEAIRNDELPKLYPETQPNNLESQIMEVIIGLKPQVKNGVLPVKTIADTFNQARSDQSQLGYRRIGQLLSTMGFRKVKTHGSAYAILWDDNLLSQNTFSDDEKNEKQPSPCPPSPPCPPRP
ncbi:MAG: hypothetical protein WBC42_02375 [Candidatus Zixiibacteriota bacterium]